MKPALDQNNRLLIGLIGLMHLLDFIKNQFTVQSSPFRTVTITFRALLR